MGDDLIGTEDGGRLGSDVDISDDGNFIAAGSNTEDDSRGAARLFYFVNDQWIQVGGKIRGDDDGNLLGGEVALSGDGNVIIAGAQRFENKDDETVGQALVYSFIDCVVEQEITVVSPSVVCNVQISNQPVLNNLCDGFEEVISVIANSDSGTSLTYQWQSLAVGATDFQDISGANNSSFTVVADASVNAGVQYRVAVTDPSGTDASCVAFSDTVTLNIGDGTPFEITGPNTYDPTVTPTGVEISVPTGFVTYQWFKDGTDLSLSDDTVTFTATSGTYTVTAENADGCIFSSAPFIVTEEVSSCPLSVDTDDQNRTVCSGFDTEIQYDFTNTGSETAILQWEFAPSGSTTFTDIAGANAPTLPLLDVVKSVDDGQYRLKVSTSECTVTSGVFTFEINPEPPIIIAGSTILPADGSPITISVSNTYDTYDWNDGEGNEQSFEISTPGTYTIEVVDAEGCIGSATVTITSEVTPAPTTNPCDALVLDFPTDVETISIASPPVTLSGATIPGGVYSGPGVIDNGDGTYSFDPSDPAVLIGDNNILYEIAIDGGVTRVGQEILNDGFRDQFGLQTELNEDGTVLIAGSFRADSRSGLVRVYDLVNNFWVQRGDDFVGGTNIELGTSVSIDNSGDVIAISAPADDVDGLTNNGATRVYEWNATTNNWDLVFAPVSGTASAQLDGKRIDINGDEESPSDR